MEELLANIGYWVEGLGVWKYVAAPLFMTVVAILPIPAEAPAMANGMIFGTALGSGITWIGAIVGAQISFEVSRKFGRPLAERLVKDPALEKVDKMVVGAGWWGLLVVRFIPLIAFTAINWGAGLTPVSRWRFLWTTALGILPATIVFTMTGSGLASLFQRFPSLAGWFTAALALLVIGYFVVRRNRGEKGESAA